jgi:hypothetical protein
MQITSELFQAREANEAVIAAMSELGDEVRRLLPPAKRDVSS